MRTDAIHRHDEMTDKTDGICDVERLNQPIKFIWNYAGNCIINQHSDTNRTHEILQDDSQCEMIVVIENHMTASARYADILLPELTAAEQPDFARAGSSGGSENGSADKALATIGCLMLAVTVAGYAGYLFWLGQLPLSINPFTLFDYHSNLVVARVALLMAGMLGWTISAMRVSNTSAAIAATAFKMIVISELAGRVFFHDIMISVGAGM